MFHQCQGSIQRIGRQSRGTSKQEQRLLKNVMSSLAVSLQDLSLNFRKGQSSYLKSKFIEVAGEWNIINIDKLTIFLAESCAIQLGHFHSLVYFFSHVKGPKNKICLIKIPNHITQVNVFYLYLI